jgi:DNA-binding HxlR family transcriptional regulator
MPEFIYNNKVYYHPAEFAIDRIGGTWKMSILWRLKDNTMRYSELKKSIQRITDKMLASQLRELEADGFIKRKVYASVPPKVEYTITRRGKKAIEIIHDLRTYGLSLMKDYKIVHKKLQK